MDSLPHLKSRRRAVQNIGQITKAMEVVAATKMRRAQELALASRPYAIEALAILRNAAAAAPVATTLTTTRPILKTLVILIASDRGLAGSFNAQLTRAANAFFSGDQSGNSPNHSYELALVGKKLAAYGAKRSIPIAGMFSGFGDHTEPREVAPLAELAIRGFRSGRWDRVVAIATHFRTTLRQEVLVRQILPTDAERIRETIDAIVPEYGRYAGAANGGLRQPLAGEYLFEPSPQELLEALVPHLVTMQLYHICLEANASEHSARRVAMKNASDNADDLGEKLAIQYNKARQAGITKELVESAATQSALG